jgi:hypothetical protein
MAGLVEQREQDPLIARFAGSALCNAGASAIPVATRLAHD